MATQTFSGFERLKSTAAIPAALRPSIARRALRPARTVRVVAAQKQKVEDAKQRLVVQLIPLVKRIALQVREHLPSHVDLDDLIGNGMMGLVDAVSKFDPNKRVKIESYARHRVRGGILDGLRSIDPASRDLRRKNKRIQKLYMELEAKLGRPVLDEEVASAMGLNLPQWYNALHEIQGVGLDLGGRLISAGPSSKRSPAEPSLLAREDANPFDLCYRREQQEILGRALSHLRPRDRQIITLYYQDELTMKQIADRLQVDESRISQLHSAALVRLKASVNAILHRREVEAPPAPAPAQMAAGAGA